MLSNGDFNIDLLKSESCDYTIRFLEQLFTLIICPTCAQANKNHSAYCYIDNIFTNDIETIESSSNGLIFSDIADHLPIFHVRNSKTYHEKMKKNEFTCKRIINDANIQSFTNTIKNVSWDNVLSKNNTAESYNEFFNLLSIAYEKNFPLRKVVKINIDKTRSPWMTKCIAKSVKQKNKLYKKYLQCPTEKKEKYTNNIKIK
jgi:hypothetical protein